MTINTDRAETRLVLVTSDQEPTLPTDYPNLPDTALPASACSLPLAGPDFETADLDALIADHDFTAPPSELVSRVVSL